MWSLQEELINLAAAPTLGAALFSFGLLPGSRSEFTCNVVTDWYRSGAETYLLVFTVRSEAGWEKWAALKACVAYSPGKTLDEILAAWIARRHIVEKCGIATPSLYSAGNGLVVEEYISHALSDIANKLDGIALQKTIIELARIAAAFDYWKFQPIAPFDDLRTHGGRPYVIDFGSDLGDPGRSIPENYSYAKLCTYLRSTALLSAATHAALDVDVLYDKAYRSLSEDAANAPVH